MNAVAAHLQADDTVAKTPDGLDAAGQSSSAYDLALIFRAGLSNPQFVHYLSMTSAALSRMRSRFSSAWARLTFTAVSWGLCGMA